MSEGIHAISVPAAQAGEFNSKTAGFYRTRDGTAIMALLAECYPDAETILSVDASRAR